MSCAISGLFRTASIQIITATSKSVKEAQSLSCCTYLHVSLVQKQDILLCVVNPQGCWARGGLIKSALIQPVFFVEIVSSYTQILRGTSCEFLHNLSSLCFQTAKSLFMNIDYNVFLPETSLLSSESEMSHIDKHHVDVQNSCH